MPTYGEYKADMAPLIEKLRCAGFKVLVTNATRWGNLMPLIMLILRCTTQCNLSWQRDIWLMSMLGSAQDHNASLKASFQLQIPALIQLVSFEDTLIMGSRRADGVVNNSRIHWAEGTLSEFISSWLPVGPFHMKRRVVHVCACVLCFVEAACRNGGKNAHVCICVTLEAKPLSVCIPVYLSLCITCHFLNTPQRSHWGF